MSHASRHRTAPSWAAVLVVVLVATVPTALAGWAGMGNAEPSVARDISERWMTLEPDRDPSVLSNKVYFNGFVSEDLTGVSPNVGTLGSSMSSDGAYSYWAMLGVWKDCNGDGFIGFGDQGLWEYRSALLVGPFNTGICPQQATPATPPLGAPPLDWMPSHNDGQWVREFLSIQWRTWNTVDTFGNPADTDPYNINDNASRVWADSGLPETDLSGSGNAGGGCTINPQPRGTYHSVGGALQWADCFDGFRVTDTFDMVIGGAGDPFGMSFADAPRDQGHSHSSLNAHNPWGEESDASIVQAWDCSQGTTQVGTGFGDVMSPTDPSTRLVPGARVNVTNVSAPSTNPAPDATGSPAGTVNATASGTDRCYRRGDVNGGSTGGSLARQPYRNEGDVTNSVTAKALSTAVLTPFEGARASAPVSTALGKGTPNDLGLKEAGQYANANGLWHNAVHWIGGAPTFGNTTFYAYVSPAAVTKYSLQLPHGSTVGTYGAETCGTHTSGIWKGWQCDASLWYRDANGNDITPTSAALGPAGTVPVAAKPGAPYDLRDIDCADQAITVQRDLHLAPWQAFDGAYSAAYPPLHELAPGLIGPNGAVATGDGSRVRQC